MALRLATALSLRAAAAACALPRVHARAWAANARRFSAQAGAEDASDRSETAIRKEILEKALPHINEHGFTLATIIAGARDAGYGSFVHGMFPRGEAELIDHIMDKNREALQPKALADPQWPQLPREEKLYRCFEHYFSMMVPYIHRWSEAMAVGMDPANLPHTTQKMFALADEVCHLSGIKSASMRWYQDRAAVAAVYVSTELFMLTDYTEDLRETKEFLQRRIDNFETFQRLAVEDPAQLQSVIYSGVTSAMSVLQSFMPSQFTQQQQTTTTTTTTTTSSQSWSQDPFASHPK